MLLWYTLPLLPHCAIHPPTPVLSSSNWIGIFPSQAADENEKGNYEQALSNHKKAQYFNAGGFINIILGGIIFLIVISISFSVASALLNSSSSSGTA